MYENDMVKERTIEVTIGYNTMQFEYPQRIGVSEDEFYEQIVDYVYSNISIDVL